MCLRGGGEVKACCICAETRGIDKLQFQEGIQLSTMEEFSQWTVDCDKVLTF